MTEESQDSNKHKMIENAPVRPKLSMISSELPFVSLEQAHQKSLEILRLERVDEICKASLDHFIDHFHFNYAVISLVNFSKRRIESKHQKADFSPASNPAHPANWIHKSNYDIDMTGPRRDILLCVMDHAGPIRMFGNFILDDCATLESLNEDIYNGHEHRTLARVYLPIIYHGKPTAEQDNVDPGESIQPGDMVMGVVELGFTDLKEGEKHLFNAADESTLLNLQVYMDNFAQCYFHALRRKAKKDARVLVHNFIDIPDHYDFLRNVLEATAQKIKANYGYVALSSFNYEKLNLSHRIFYPYDVQLTDLEIPDQGGRQGITRHVAKTRKPYLAPNVSDDPHYLVIHPDVKSEMAVPMIREGEVVGVMVFSSVRENFFNRLHLYTVEKVASALAGLFFKKKQFKIVSDLSPSVKLFSESTSEIYKYIVEILESYFDSKYVSVWVRKSKSTLEFDLHEATNREFYEKYVQSNFTKRSIKDNKVEEDRLYYVQVVEEYENKNSTIYKFCIAQGFQTYIVINVTMEDDYKVFFNVFSKSPLHGSKFSLEDKIFLEQISRRTRNALQSAAMVRSFINISEGLNKQNLKETLRTIAKSALEVLQADIVTVFPYREGQVIKIEDGEHAGEFSSNFYKKEGRPAYLVNIIAKNGTAWLENTEQYHELLEKNGRFFENEEQRQQSFWHANEIQSLAAVQVRTADQVLGVMCINYRSPRKFQLEEPRKKVIMAFTNLAVSAFLNASTLEQIRKEKQEIEAKHQANAELLEKILPNATRASYWEILEGLNHDIRRGLISLGQATFNITSKIKDLSQKDRTRMGECKAIIDHNTRLVNNLLNLFDFSQTGKTVVNVNKIIKEIIFFFDHRNPNLNFDTKSLLDIPDMKCFKMELSMIWYNLTNNAVWAVQEVGEKHTGIIRFSSAYIDDEYILTIEDNGIGIDNQLKNKIFDLRVTSKQDGLGIGLYIVRETLRNSFQGDISVDSAKGHGAKFTIKIPGYINYID